MAITTPVSGRPVAVVVAMPQEAAVFGRRLPRNTVVSVNNQLLLFVCGIGPVNAQRGALALLGSQPGGLVSWGTAGGLAAALTKATCLLPHVVLGDDAAYETDSLWRDRLLQRLQPSLTINTGAMLSASRIVATRVGKQSLHEETGAVAVDMESSAIAAVAAQAGLPFVCIRTILDTVATDLPSFLHDTIDADGFPDKRKFGMALARHPARVRDAARLARDFNSAKRTLEQVLKLTDKHLLSP